MSWCIVGYHSFGRQKVIFYETDNYGTCSYIGINAQHIWALSLRLYFFGRFFGIMDNLFYPYRIA